MRVKMIDIHDFTKCPSCKNEMDKRHNCNLCSSEGYVSWAEYVSFIAPHLFEDSCTRELLAQHGIAEK